MNTLRAMSRELREWRVLDPEFRARVERRALELADGDGWEAGALRACAAMGAPRAA